MNRKRWIIFLFCVFLINFFVAAGVDSTGNGNVSLEYDEDKISYYAECLGLGSDFSYIKYPKTLNDYDNNIIYAALHGDYSPTIHFQDYKTLQWFENEMFKKTFFHSKRKGEENFNRYYCLVSTYGHIFGYNANQRLWYKETKATFGYDLTITVDCVDKNHYQNGIPTEEQFFIQQNEGVELLIKLRNSLHEQQIITDSMNEYEVFMAYAKYYCQNTKKGFIKASQKYGKIKCDGLLAHIGGFYGNCWGVASDFTVSMLLEGIKAQNYFVEGHIITRVLADGKEYFFDFYSERENNFNTYTSEEDYVKNNGVGRRGFDYGEGQWLLF